MFNTVASPAKGARSRSWSPCRSKGSEIDLGGMLRSGPTLIASQGYPTEIFEVAPEIVEHHERFARLISHRAPATDVAPGPSGRR
ncbi:hypothetical protein E4N62_39930 [Streptomyces sp. MNU76]|uniref:hypothetical protein n=1 Tax=Streptomyces sp. MNU76 TaxID=2560026 RepID=UPI001E5F962D|nr:hypothetical protein [Streptomyces sp. MNU76]MCC9710866.1 hypothetical protein [Streptomyces sp. MNU76]